MCSSQLLGKPILFGEPGVIVQIDESLFDHNSKVSCNDIGFIYYCILPILIVSKKSCACSYFTVWVFGMYDTQMKQGYMTLVSSRNTLTLLPNIEEHTLPGIIIHSDMWAAYRQVAQLPTVVARETVNHRRHFVDPTKGAHTQAIESYWARAKAKLKRMMGTTKEMLPSYLDEFTWKERHGRSENGEIDNAVVLSKMINAIAKENPVM